MKRVSARISPTCGAAADGTIGGAHLPSMGPVNANEIAIYAVETRAIIHILWGLLLIAAISLIGVSITYVLLRIKLRSAEKRERQLARHVGISAAEIKRLEERLALRVDLEAQIAGAEGPAPAGPSGPREAGSARVGERLGLSRGATGRLKARGCWRRGPESNRPTRICNPVHNRFATAPCDAGQPGLPASTR